MGAAWALSIPAGVAATLLACVVCGRRRVPAAGAAAIWLCAAAVLLAGCGSPGQARPGASGTGSSRVAPGAWRAESSGTRQPLYAVACLSALRCEAVGAAGTIVSTGDGGATWRAQASPLHGSSTILYRIACVAPSSCYVIARPGTILVTHDGGATWSNHVLPLTGAGGDLTDRSCPAGSGSGIGGRYAMCRLGILTLPASAPVSATPWPPGRRCTPTRRLPARARPGRRSPSG